MSLGDAEIIANDVIDEFMRILKRNGLLSYHLNPPIKGTAILVPGERNISETDAFKAARDIVINGEEMGESNWESENPPQNGLVMLHIDQYEASLVIPVKWERSVRKLLSEYLSLKYIMMDIPEGSAKQIARECARRMDCILNKTKTGWGYATPYQEFIHPHMEEFNQIVLSSIATPAGLPVHLVGEKAMSSQLKLRVSFEGVRISEVQWPRRLDVLRFLDEENNLWKLDWQGMLNSEVSDRLYDIDEILDEQHLVSRTATATLMADMENNQMVTPEGTLLGHMEFIRGSSDRVLQPATYQEFLAMYSKFERKVGGMRSRLGKLIQPWKGTPPRGIQIKWRGDEPYLYDPSEFSKKRNKRSFNRSMPSGRGHCKQVKRSRSLLSPKGTVT